MNKRQAKKAAKKVTYPLVDEFNLLTLSPEEYNKAIKDFNEYVQKHCRYKHYKDKWKAGKAPFSYHFPVGESGSPFFRRIIQNTRKCPNITTVNQSLVQLYSSYSNKSNAVIQTDVYKKENPKYEET